MSVPVTHKDDIFQSLKENSAKLRSFGVERIGLFRSFVRGQQDDESDVDVYVAFDPSQKTFDNFMGLSFFLEDLFGRKVEIVTKESLSPYIGPPIMDEIEYVTVAA